MTFTLGSAVPFSDDAVIRTGKLWEAGSYLMEDGTTYEITPEQLPEAVAAFTPVDIVDTHLPSVFNGMLGKVLSIEIDSDGKSLRHISKVPKWLNDRLPDTVPVSAGFYPGTKRLKHMALVPNPRIADACLAAAFAQFPEHRPDAATFHDVRRFAQKVHDLGSSAGGQCAPAATFSTQETTSMSWTERLKGWIQGGMVGEAPAPEPAPAASTPAPAPQPAPVAPAFSQQPDPETAALRERVAAFEKREAERIEADAVAFAKGEVTANRILPEKEQEARERYLRAAKDDASLGAVTFSTGQTTRVAQLRADYAARAPHKLTQELAGSGQQPAAVLFNQTGSETEGLIKQAGDVARAYAERMNRGGK